VDADIVLIDVGPNLGAINRAALISADTVLMPLAADLFSLKGLSNLGPTLRQWRTDWQSLVLPRVPKGISAPRATMQPLGYVIMQPEMRLDRPVKAYERWLQRIPWVYSSAVLGESPPSRQDDSHRIATMRNYRSLMPLAHDARKPMFDLKPGRRCTGQHSAVRENLLQGVQGAVRRSSRQGRGPPPGYRRRIGGWLTVVLWRLRPGVSV
jgi:hypothetical protein